MLIPDNTLRNSLIATYGVEGLESDDLELPYGGGCPAVYRAKYVDRTLVEDTSYAIDYGSLIHDVLYLHEEEGLPLLPDALNKAWARVEDPETGERLPTLGPAAYQEAVDDLTAYMERSGLGLATIAVEQELTMPLVEYRGTQYLFGGRLDWLGIDPTEEEISTIYVRDYKTDRQPPSKEKVRSLPQMTGYAALVRANLNRYLPDVDPSQVRIVVLYDAVKWYELPSEREHWEMDAWQDWAAAVCRKIVDDPTGAPLLNDNCAWCPLKFDCPEFQKLPAMGSTLAAQMSTTTDLTARIQLMQEAELVISGLKGMVADVKEELKIEAAAEPIIVGGKIYEVGDKFETEWDVVGLQRLLGVKFYDVINVVGGKVEDLVKRDTTGLKEAVEACSKKMATGRRLAAKKYKEK